MKSLALVLVSLLGACDREPICNVGCLPIELTIPYPMEADVATARIEMCRNELCSEGPLPAAPGHTSTLVGQLRNATSTLYRTANNQLELVTESNYMDYAQLSNGDAYSIVVRTADGRVLAQESWRASYREFSRCGDDRPGDVCMTAEFSE